MKRTGLSRIWGRGVMSYSPEDSETSEWRCWGVGSESARRDSPVSRMWAVAVCDSA
jgi:hypothetical protein